jgi:hypothetical protein
LPDNTPTPAVVHDASDFGTVATHESKQLPPVLVGSATGQELNTVGLDLPPVACMSLHDLVFETDSSFVMPDAGTVLRNLGGLRQGHKNKQGDLPLLSIFGHADPSGTDDYNKALSGRRATAIYGLLIHDITVWDKLYNSPFGGDNWQKANVLDHIKSFLGPGAPIARSDLFLAYMKALLPDAVKKTDFLGRGASPGGKADYQGCSDFNPLLILSQDENQNLPKARWRLLNQVNRRVVLFLFSASRKIDTSLWPCPLAAEGVAACHKRFFSNADERRAAGPERREFSKTKDTFACRFYQFFAESSPCERIVPFVKIRLFDHFGAPVFKAPFQTDFPGAASSGTSLDSFVTITKVEVPASGKVKWRRPFSEKDVTTLPDDSDKFEYELEVFIDDKEDDREECTRRRLNNFGYVTDTNLEKNIRDFQQDIGRVAPDGTVDDIFDDLERLFNACTPPLRHPVSDAAPSDNIDTAASDSPSSGSDDSDPDSFTPGSIPGNPDQGNIPSEDLT